MSADADRLASRKGVPHPLPRFTHAGAWRKRMSTSSRKRARPGHAEAAGAPAYGGLETPEATAANDAEDITPTIKRIAAALKADKAGDLQERMLERILRSENHLRIFKAIGVDPSGPEAKQFQFYLLVWSNHITVRVDKETAKHPSWTREDDDKLERAVRGLNRECGSEREAVRRIAADPAYSFSSYKRQNGRKTPKSNHQTQYEKALWRRWMKIKKDKKLWREELKAKGLEDYNPLPIMFRFVEHFKLTGEI